MLGGIFSSVKTYLYLALAIAVVTLITMAYRDYSAMQAELKNKIEAVAELEQQKTALTVERDSLQTINEAMTIAMETQQEAIRIVNDQFGEIRDERERQKRVLEGGRLARIAAEEAGIIETRSNIATAERLAEFEGVINEDF